MHTLSDDHLRKELDALPLSSEAYLSMITIALHVRLASSTLPLSLNTLPNPSESDASAPSATAARTFAPAEMYAAGYIACPTSKTVRRRRDCSVSMELVVVPVASSMVIMVFS